MSEIEVRPNVIIDDKDAVEKFVKQRLRIEEEEVSVDIDKIVDFITSEKDTFFYIDDAFFIKTENDKTEYLWLDTGLFD